jgi:hypothetical protein
MKSPDERAEGGGRIGLVGRAMRIRKIAAFWLENARALAAQNR